MMTPETFKIFLASMCAVALVVFIVLFFVDAGYGKFYNPKWGPAVGNRIGWVLMESPVFIAMLVLWFLSDRRDDIVRLIFLIIFELHYFQRSFIFPCMIRGKSVMPLSIILMGATFNTVNALIQGGWLFYISPAEMYPLSWLTDWRFIAGTLIFAAGFFINIQSDSIIRNLRKPGDTKHYFPKKGMFRYVTSANYFGEFIEWTGFAILTWSFAGVVFAVWTFANLAPRASRINVRYHNEFPEEFEGRTIRKMLPFIW